MTDNNNTSTSTSTSTAAPSAVGMVDRRSLALAGLRAACSRAIVIPAPMIRAAFEFAQPVLQAPDQAHRIALALDALDMNDDIGVRTAQHWALAIVADAAVVIRSRPAVRPAAGPAGSAGSAGSGGSGGGVDLQALADAAADISEALQRP